MNKLPIDDYLNTITSTLEQVSSIVISAAPGSGKTTRVPPALLNVSALCDKQVWVLEPRRMAAVAAAHRISEERNLSVGQDVGYQVRFENKTSHQTQIVFLTEALLARKIISDPQLSQVGAIVLDEFHERSLHVDLALGLLKELQMLSRPDLKIVVMSATLDAQALSNFLDSCPVVQVPGQLHPIQYHKIKSSQLLNTDFRFVELVAEHIKAHIQNTPQGRDTLVFLPGVSEITRIKTNLSTWAEKHNIVLIPLHASLSLHEQMQALSRITCRKVILSTNIAESSVTIDGVDCVIDSGLVRQSRIHAKTDFAQLTTSRISKASATQRAGRSARQYPGKCIQLWNTLDERSMPDFDTAEIHRSDLKETVLFLKRWGVQDLNSFCWFEKPDQHSLEKAIGYLQKIGAIQNNSLTAHGIELSQLPLPPELSQILLIADHMGFGPLGCDICGILQERDLHIPISDQGENDLYSRLELLWEYRNHNRQIDSNNKKTLIAIDKISQQLKSYIKTVKQNEASISPLLVSEIMLLSFPQHLCRRRNAQGPTATLVGGRGVILSEFSHVKKSEFFIAIQLLEVAHSPDTKVNLACGVPVSLLSQHFAEHIKTQKYLDFNQESEQFVVFEGSSLWDLPLEAPRKRAAKSEEIQDQFAELTIKSWDKLMRDHTALAEWWNRYLYYRKKIQKTPLWDEQLRFLAMQQACYGETSWRHLLAKDLLYYMESALPQDEVQDFNKKCPAKIKLASGKLFKLHYHLDKDPHLEVKLQELFGQTHTPRIWDEQIPITLHLLAPNFRPVQTTQDLASFWINTYPEVKKQLKARYPRHRWD